MSSLREELKTVVRLIQPGLGGDETARSLGVAMIVYFPVCGFLFGYLWTRLFLVGALQKADLATITHRAEEQAIVGAAQSVTSVESFAATRALSPQDAVTARALVEKRRGLWVDDTPTNNVALQQSFEKLLDISFDLSLSTEDALARVNSTHYSVIISDMGRPPDPRAGYTLLDRLQADGVTIPFIIYAASGANLANRAEAQQHKAFGMTNSPQELLSLLQTALNDQR